MRRACAATVNVQPVSVSASTSRIGPSTPVRSGISQESWSPATRCAEFAAETGGRSGRVARVPRSRSLPTSASRAARLAVSTGCLADSSASTEVGRAAQSHSRRTAMQASNTASGTGPSGPSSSARSLCPHPRSVSRPTTRPVSAPAVILPDKGTPSFAMPVGHCLRGARSMPGRSSRARVAATASASTDRSGRAPVQLSQRPQPGASAPRLGSSSCRRRKFIRQSVVRW
ncbi:Uncharacterised protein [Mycobacteroides abscessus subsp. abscessus]|nr:Uncharacterised protein [Mycobacteroides abscessus subsp. abscessus]